MKVYPKIIVYCPKTKQEQAGNKCLSCELYKGYKIDSNLIIIDCKSEG